MKDSLPWEFYLVRIAKVSQQDDLVIFRANEAKSQGTLIYVYGYVEACQRTLLLIAHTEHAHWLSDLWCSQVDTAHMGSTSDLCVCGDPAVGYVL